jgi:hypothetical protein
MADAEAVRSMKASTKVQRSTSHGHLHACTLSETDGHFTRYFCAILKIFYCRETDVAELASQMRELPELMTTKSTKIRKFFGPPEWGERLENMCVCLSRGVPSLTKVGAGN